MGKYVFYLNRILYCLSSDSKVEKIEEILCCTIVNGKGRYYGKYVSYLATGHVNTDKVNELQYTIKKHVEIIEKNYNFIIKVYHYPLPDFVYYEPHQTKDIVLGIGYNGLVKVPISTETNNYLICGCSGSGKSTLAISIIKNLLDNSVQCIICDNKSSFSYDFLKCPVYKGLENCLIQLNKLEQEVNKRMKENKKHSIYLFVIDEIFPFLLLESKERRRVMNQLAYLLSVVRSVNIHLILITQKATHDIIDTKILANVNYRICLQVSSKLESSHILSCDDAFFITTKGRAYLSINGKITEFQSYYTKSEPKQDKNSDIENGTIAQDIEYNENIESSKTLKEKESFHSKFL